MIDFLGRFDSRYHERINKVWRAYASDRQELTEILTRAKKHGSEALEQVLQTLERHFDPRNTSLQATEARGNLRGQLFAECRIYLDSCDRDEKGSG